MPLGAQANAAGTLERQMLSRLDEQTFVGGKRVARQQLPDLPEHAETTVHRVKVSLLDPRAENVVHVRRPGGIR